MAAERKVVAVNFEDIPPADDLAADAALVANVKGVARTMGYLVGDWTIKENKNGRTINFSCSRVPWEQLEVPFEKEPGDEESTE